MKKEDRDLAKRFHHAAEDYFSDMKKFMARRESTSERTFQPDIGRLLRDAATMPGHGLEATSGGAALAGLEKLIYGHTAV